MGKSSETTHQQRTDIAIVGAGVAGSRLAYLLAGRGFKVTLFDPNPAWEKPCGGGLTDKLVTEFGDVVEDLPEIHANLKLEIVSSRGRRACITMERPLVTVSRRVLGELLLDKAVRAGASFRKEKVIFIRKEAEENELVTKAGTYRAGLVVGADGVNSLVRRTFLRPFPREELWFTHGVLLPVEVNLPIIIKFFYGSKGYAWIFPRTGQTSVGIAARKSEGLKRSQLVERLREFTSNEFARGGLPLPELGRPYAWLLPSLGPQAFADNAVTGPGWALVGDASGSVDPLTGEGIYYALKTAHLLAEALIQGSLQAYAPAWKAMATTSIAKVSKKRDTFYHPTTLRLLGLLLDYSPSVRALIRDIICGSQKYDTLRSRVKAELPSYAKETLFNLVNLRKGKRQDRQSRKQGCSSS
jgi:flavin-dependent dehydrogenase